MLHANISGENQLNAPAIEGQHSQTVRGFLGLSVSHDTRFSQLIGITKELTIRWRVGGDWGAVQGGSPFAPLPLCRRKDHGPLPLISAALKPCGLEFRGSVRRSSALQDEAEQQVSETIGDNSAL